ncbi:hypothetical protein [Pusillimonas sp.]|uniref:hypothetical protein n=1 Tax=Pusillimonas sp. TaxID=3040095 RepID=UPI0037C99872
MPATRYAYFIGRPIEGQSEQFMQELSAIVTGFSTLPGVKSAQLERPYYFESDELDIYAAVRLSFDSPKDIDAALATTRRQELRAQFAERVKPLFEGVITHINYEGDEHIQG